jgi:GNAT superfamily N-acetyltransferase
MHINIFAFTCQQEVALNLFPTVQVMREYEKEVLTQLQPGTPEYTYISSMAVAEGNRRKGLASAVLHAAEQQSEIWGQPHVALHVGGVVCILYFVCTVEWR